MYNKLLISRTYLSCPCLLEPGSLYYTGNIEARPSLVGSCRVSICGHILSGRELALGAGKRLTRTLNQRLDDIAIEVIMGGMAGLLGYAGGATLQFPSSVLRA